MSKAPPHASFAANARQPRQQSSPTGVPRCITRWIRSVAVFGVIFLVVVLARKAGFATGYWVLALAGIGLVLLPTARLFSQRILFNGLIAFGFFPLLWWIPESQLGTDHGTFVLAACTGIIGAWICFGRRPVNRIRRLLPVVRWIDLLPMLAGLFSFQSMATFLSIRSADAALSIMTSRWDFQSHFTIYNMLRTQGSVIPMAPLPSTGGSWGFIEYPQGFHSLLATFAEIVSPISKGLDAELVSYINLQAILCGLTVVLITAGICSLPSVRQNALLLSPAIAIAVAAWVMGPGAIPIFEGFANFYVGCGMAAATILSFLAPAKKISIVVVAAMGAGIVGTSNNWILLVSLIAVVALIALTSVVLHRRLYSRRWWVSLALIGAITSVGVLLPISQVLPLLGAAEGILAASGGMPLPEFGWVLAIISLVITLGVANLNQPRATLLQDLARRRAGTASLGILLPVAVCAWLAYTQTNGSGSLSYYFYKYLVAVELVAWALFVAALATLLTRYKAASTSRTPVALGVTLCVSALAATQVFGFSVTGQDEVGLPPTALPMVQSSLQEEQIANISPTVQRILASAHLGQEHDAVYVSAGSDINDTLALRWQLGMNNMLTTKYMGLEAQLAEITLENAENIDIISDVLASDADLYVMVNPELYARVSGTLDNPEFEHRLLNVG